MSKMTLREIGIAHLIESMGGVCYDTLHEQFGASDFEINNVVTKMQEDKQ